MYYLINPANLNAPPTTTFVPYILKTPTPQTSSSVSQVTLTPASGTYTTSSSRTSINTFAPVSSNSTTLSSYLNNSSSDTSSDTSTPNNVSPNSLTTTSVPIYTYSNEPVSTTETPTPSNSSISTTPISTTPSTTTPVQISESFIEGIDTSTGSSKSPSTSSTMTNSTKNINTAIPTSIATKPKKTYILHLTKDAQINSKLHFASYEYISTGDLERVSNEIIVTPDTFTAREGLDEDSSSSSTPGSGTSAGPIAGPIASQILKGFPDFNSCANSAPTLPPNASNDFSGCSMLYITDCVGYYVYSAQFKNNTLIMQLNTDDNRKMTAGYYRLVI